MTQPDLERLRELLANATPGPWKAVRHTVIDRSVLMSFLRRTPDITIGSGSEGDAPLIAEARNALPGLLDTIEALTAERDRLREAATACRDQFAFYAREYLAAGKVEKAATNQSFADLVSAALNGEPS